MRANLLAGTRLGADDEPLPLADRDAGGEYGRIGDGLDSNEALQNAFVRHLKSTGKHDSLLANNPSIALPPELHRQIGNLT